MKNEFFAKNKFSLTLAIIDLLIFNGGNRTFAPLDWVRCLSWISFGDTFSTVIETNRESNWNFSLALSIVCSLCKSDEFILKIEKSLSENALYSIYYLLLPIDIVVRIIILYVERGIARSKYIMKIIVSKYFFEIIVVVLNAIWWIWITNFVRIKIIFII